MSDHCRHLPRLLSPRAHYPDVPKNTTNSPQSDSLPILANPVPSTLGTQHQWKVYALRAPQIPPPLPSNNLSPNPPSPPNQYSPSNPQIHTSTTPPLNPPNPTKHSSKSIPLPSLNHHIRHGSTHSPNLGAMTGSVRVTTTVAVERCIASPTKVRHHGEPAYRIEG